MVTPLPTVKVSVELPPVVTELGLKAAVTPLGNPVIERATVSAEPDTGAVLMVLVPCAPWATESEAGLALMEKSLVTAVGVAMLPRPVGPSQPVPALHMIDGLQVPFEPEVTS